MAQGIAPARTRLWVLFSILTAAWSQKEGLVVPLRRKDGGLIARGLLRNATLPLHGAVKDYGYFYATLMLGSPSRTFAVIVDTGSTITYVPCTTCGHNCGPHHKDAAFDPVASSSSSSVACGADRCICGRPACGCSSENQCTYSRTYAEQSSSAGVLIEDKLQLGEDGVSVVFGCETKETGEIFNQEADGIMGLGNSEVSLVNQLASRGVIEDVFSLCFGSVEGDGALLLGEVPLSQYSVELEYTPLLASAAYPHYYSVQLVGLQVGATPLDVPAGRFEEGYGTVLDSGTTFTYLPSDAFKAFREAVTAFAISRGLKTTKGPDPKFYDICFGGAPHVEHADQLEHVFPHMELQFQGVKLRLGPLNYLFMHTAEAGAYCLGVFDNGQAGTLLGGITFRNILVQYDRRNQRVGFGTAPCQALGLGQKPCPNGSAEGFLHINRATAIGFVAVIGLGVLALCSYAAVQLWARRRSSIPAVVAGHQLVGLQSATASEAAPPAKGPLNDSISEPGPDPGHSRDGVEEDAEVDEGPDAALTASLLPGTQPSSS